MIDIKYLLPGLVLAEAVIGCSHVSSIGDGGPDTDTGPVECNLGEYSGDFTRGICIDLGTPGNRVSVVHRLE